MKPDNDDATKWGITHRYFKGERNRVTFKRDRVEVGVAFYAAPGEWSAALADCAPGDIQTFPTDREAEAWVCAQTGHPGTTTPPDEPGDCEGEGA